MAVKPSYKQTEVGVIPEEWDVKRLGDLFHFSGGYSASRDQLSDKGYCYLHYGDIHTSNRTFVDVQTDFQSIPKLEIPLKHISSKSLLEDGDVVFVDASEDDAGTSKHVVIVNTNRTPFISGLHTIVAKSKADALDHTYRRFCFQTAAVQRQFLFYAVGTKVSGISKTNIAKLFLPIPPKSEQRAIASALSDVDALLRGLDLLIAKKRDIKQAVMEELLTGRKRLEGFEGGWVEVSLGMIAEISMGQSPDSKYYNRIGHGVPLIQGNADIEDRRSIARVWTTQITKEGRAGDLLLTVRAPVGAVGRITERCCLGRGVCSLRPKGDVDYLFHALVFFESAWKVLEQGSTFTSANSTQVASFSVSMPADPSEQTAIAKVLTVIDEELMALQQRLEKTRFLKQAMMQELLTGKTRLL